MGIGNVGLYGERVAVVLGFVTLGLFIAMAVTCRKFLPFASRLGMGSLTNSAPYQALFKLHSYFWYGLGLVLVLHLMAGLLHTEIPQKGDPDAAIHWAILIFALTTLTSLVLVFSNCRSFATVLKIFRGDRVLTGAYGRYYQLHSFFWVLLLVALAGHLVASYMHIGFWPTQLE